MYTFFKLESGTVLNVHEIGTIFNDGGEWKVVMCHTGVDFPNPVVITLSGQSDYEKLCRYLVV